MAMESAWSFSNYPYVCLSSIFTTSPAGSAKRPLPSDCRLSISSGCTTNSPTALGGRVRVSVRAPRDSTRAWVSKHGLDAAAARDSRLTRVTADPPGESTSGLARGHGRPARHDPNPSAGCRCHTPMIWVAGVPPAWSFGKRAGRRRDARSPWALPPQLLPNHTRQRAGSGTPDQAIRAALREIPGATPARSPF